MARNNFDLLRLLFAGTVCLVHAYRLSGFKELGTIVGFLSSEVAVKAFFVLSGFLIFRSFERSSSLSSYVRKRIRRIYPAYFTVVTLCAIGLVLVSSMSITQYFSSEWGKYVLANLSFLNFMKPTLPGVFELNKVTAVNGALWTLKIEVMFYASVPLFVFLFGRIGRFPVLVSTYCLSVVYVLLCNMMAGNSGSEMYFVFARQLPGQLSYFMAGAFFYYYLGFFERRTGYFIVIAALVLAADIYYPFPIFEPFALATVVVFCGLFFYLGNFGKYGDLSYGVYILHFPIIQLILQAGWFRESPWLYLMTIALITTAGAFLLWHLVEKRFLLRSSHYLGAATASIDADPRHDSYEIKSG